MEQSGYDEPNYTQTPNPLFDEHMRAMGDAELRVVLCAVRKTFGYHKLEDGISLTQFQDMTGLSRQGAIDGIEAAINRGVMKQTGTGRRGVGIYALSIITTGQASRPVKPVDQSTQLTRTGQASRPELVKPVDTQKKITKENIQKKKTSASVSQTAGRVPSKPEKKSSKKQAARKPDPLFDALAEHIFGAKPEDKSAVKAVSGRTGKLVSFLKDRKCGTPEGIALYLTWYARVHSDRSLPLDDAKFATSWLEFEASPDAAVPVIPPAFDEPAAASDTPAPAEEVQALTPPEWMKTAMDAAEAAGQNKYDAAIAAMLERKAEKKRVRL